MRADSTLSTYLLAACISKTLPVARIIQASLHCGRVDVGTDISIMTGALVKF